jgi:hypothetical protein
MLKRRKIISVIFLICLFSGAGFLLSEEVIITNDGTRITGEIVGFDNGWYQIQIGRFVKKVAESDVRQIIDVATGSAESLSATVSPSAVSKSAGSPPAISPNYSGASGTSIEATDSPKAVLDKITAGNPALAQYMEMQKSNGVSSDAMVNQLQQMQGNPMMLQIMSKFKDPAFQQNFLANINKMKEAMNVSDDGTIKPESQEPDQNVQVLKGLFEQLNNAKSPQ